MTNWIFANLKSTITYWSPGARDGFGQITFSKSTIKGRWVDKAEQFNDREGQEVTSSAIVYLRTDVSLDGYLLNGSSTASDPTTLTDDAYQVRAFKKTPDLKMTGVYERKAFL